MYAHMNVSMHTYHAIKEVDADFQSSGSWVWKRLIKLRR